MATDLFGKYYNNPTKSYVYSNMTCNGASADEMSFDITKQAGVISNNEAELSKIDLSSVHVGMTQYTSDMKTINPFGFIYVRGIDCGEAYTQKAFGLVSEKALEVADWEYLTTAVVHIKYLDERGNRCIKHIVASGSKDDGIKFEDDLQKSLEGLKLPINVSYKDRYLYFVSTQLGYDFWISMIELWHWFGEGEIDEAFPGIFDNLVDTPKNSLGLGMDDTWVNPKGYNPNIPDKDILNVYTHTKHESRYRELYDYLERRTIEDASTNENVEGEMTTDLVGSCLFEDLTKYIPFRKYRNGAMKGCVIVATYPVYNASSIQDTQRSLRLGFMKDRIEEYYTSQQNSYLGFPMYVRVVKDVVDSYYAQYEEDTYRRWANEKSYLDTKDGWLEPEEVPTIAQDHTPDESSPWGHSNVPNYYMLGSVYKEVSKRDVVGLYGYATYLTKTYGWEPFGQFYARTAVEDDESTGYKNLIPSFLIYNPNSFPVSVNYMTFA